MTILHFTELTSTNDYAMGNELPHGTYVTADLQTAGRGQRGNKWESQKGENLMFSLVIEPHHIPVTEQYRISMMAALAASDAIREFGINCEIKWSNDLYVNGLKIGGILIEHSFMSEMLSKSVIGIGININQNQFPKNLPNPTSMALSGCTDCTPDKLLAIFDQKFSERYQQTTAELHRDYMERLWLRGQKAMYRDANRTFEATIHSVNPKNGMLTLKDIQGEHHSYWFKEVEFVICEGL